MIQLTLICVGKMKEKHYIDAAAEYLKRLGAWCRVELTELPEVRLPDAPSPEEVAAALRREGESIAARIPKGAAVVALCVEGREMDSVRFSREVQSLAVTGGSKLCFVIGGSFGLAPAVKARADLRLSMSEMTFPHHLARVMLIEQLYRGFKINEGSRYHK